MRNFHTHILSGHSVQFIIIFIIKTSVLLSRELGEKVSLLFNGGLPGAIGLLTKSATFILAPDLINSVISQYSGEYGQ